MSKVAKRALTHGSFLFSMIYFGHTSFLWSLEILDERVVVEGLSLDRREHLCFDWSEHLLFTQVISNFLEHL